MILRHVLPCTACQLAYDQHLLHLPYPKDPADLPRWVFDLHHRVNGTTRPLWETWSASYPKHLNTSRLKDIWPFLQSVAMCYPTGKRTSYNEVGLYQKYVGEFLEMLWEFLANMKGYDKDVKHIQDMIGKNNLHQNIQSRKVFQKWITDIGRKIHIFAAQSQTSSCENICKK